MQPTEISPIWLADNAVEAGWQQFPRSIGISERGYRGESLREAQPFGVPRSLALRLGINNLLLLRIRDRGLRAASIPGAFMRLLATELGAPLKGVVGYLEGPACLAPSSAFRSAASRPPGRRLILPKR